MSLCQTYKVGREGGGEGELMLGAFFGFLWKKAGYLLFRTAKRLPTLLPDLSKKKACSSEGVGGLAGG